MSDAIYLAGPKAVGRRLAWVVPLTFGRARIVVGNEDWLVAAY